MNDNRHYQYSSDSVTKRDEYSVILNWIPEGSSVIDLGCGDGSLLKILKKKGITGEGIEISQSGVKASKKKGLNVKRGKIDTKLGYKDKYFDYAVCNTTLQMVMYPEVLLSEMVRISKKQIISFPNFGFLLNRFDFLLKGRLPRFMLYGYTWYSTGHIHQLSVNDFRDYCKNHRLKILDAKYYSLGGYSSTLSQIINLFPNSLSLSAMFLISK